MRALITGNLGYLGPVVVSIFKKAGWHTVGLDRGWYLPTYDLTDYADTLPDQQIFADLRNIPKHTLPSRIDVVVHLAGLSNDPISELDETLTKKINIISTIAMIDNYPEARHVVASSASVYGATEPHVLSKEIHDPNPLTQYALAKARVDSYLESFVNTPEAYDWISLRFGTLWGWSPNIRRDIVANAFCWQAARDRNISPATNARRPMLHVSDAAALIGNSAVTKHGGTVNCAAENLTVSQIAEKVARATESTLVPCPESNIDARDYWLDTTKMSSTVGIGHDFVTLNDAGEIWRVFSAAQKLGEAYPTRIQRVKEIIAREGRL